MSVLNIISPGSVTTFLCNGRKHYFVLLLMNINQAIFYDILIFEVNQGVETTENMY